MPSAEQWGRDFERRPGWTTWKAAVVGTLIVLGIVAIVGVATTGSVFFQGAAAKKTVGARTNVKVFTPENKIAQISFFHDTCNTAAAQVIVVRNLDSKYLADQHDARFAKDPIRQQQASDRLEQDSTDLTGAKNALAQTAASYNSRSRQSTANVFKGTGLPDQITIPEPITAGFHINCG